MYKFCVSTDSGCDLPISLCNERKIYPLQMTYYIGEEEFRDTMNHEDFKDFYRKIRDGAMPRTSQINVYEFVSFWESLLHHKLPIIHICLGSGISGTYSNGLQAVEIMKEKYPEQEIYLVDSTLASVGYGMLAIKAAELRDQGKTPQECVEWLEKHKIEINTYYTTDNLEYLYRSGRVSRTGAIIGTALKINPILNLNKEGHLLVQEKIRGTKATIRRIHAIVKELVVNPQEQTLYICHSDIPEKAKAFGEGLKKDIGFRDIYYTYIGSTIGTHSGPGLMAAFFYGKPRA
ncbi:MAG: DegV family protein [Caldicoprobacterales bacterium]|jgi:DegV family protein with EDD domain|nr:DegV family protein [Clostridiales bacterium]